MHYIFDVVLFLYVVLLVDTYDLLTHYVFQIHELILMGYVYYYAKTIAIHLHIILLIILQLLVKLYDSHFNSRLNSICILACVATIAKKTVQENNEKRQQIMTSRGARA